jgi:hypothetical protein
MLKAFARGVVVVDDLVRVPGVPHSLSRTAQEIYYILVFAFDKKMFDYLHPSAPSLEIDQLQSKAQLRQQEQIDPELQLWRDSADLGGAIDQLASCNRRK